MILVRAWRAWIRVTSIFILRFIGTAGRGRLTARPSVMFGLLACVSLPVLIWAPEKLVDSYGQYAKGSHVLSREQYTRAVDDYRKTFAQILAGVGGLYGLYLLTRRTRATEEGQITERFTRAIEQLGACNKDGDKLMEVRFGGIYALERIARDSRRDHWPIIEILCAYLRHNASSTTQTTPVLHRDIQAIVTVLSRRKAHWDTPYHAMGLYETNLKGGNFQHGKFKSVILWKSDLTNASFLNADLRNADLRAAILERADLTGANLAGAVLLDTSLRNARLCGVNFREHYDIHRDWVPELAISLYAFIARMAGRKVTKESLVRQTIFTRADFFDADLTGADLSNADLRESLNLTPEQIQRAVVNERTRLPPCIDFRSVSTHRESMNQRGTAASMGDSAEGREEV